MEYKAIDNKAIKIKDEILMKQAYKIIEIRWHILY